MVDINTSGLGLRAQLQAQLQSNRADNQPRRGLDLTPSAQERLADRKKSEQPQTAGGNRTDSGRSALQLSSSEDIEAAKTRVSTLSVTNREAPVGRLSTQGATLRNQPLGQIIDIYV